VQQPTVGVNSKQPVGVVTPTTTTVAPPAIQGGSEGSSTTANNVKVATAAVVAELQATVGEKLSKIYLFIIGFIINFNFFLNYIIFCIQPL